MTVQNIIGGKTADGVKYLELFLQDYTKLFSTKVNPNCSKCISGYLNKYKLKIFDMDSNCDYKLRKKFNGIPLSFGSSTFLSNGNLTNKLAEELVKNHKAIHAKKGTTYNIDNYFEKYPKNWDIKDVEEKEAKEVKPKNKRKPRKRNA